MPVLQAPGGPPLTGVQALALGDHYSCARFGGGEVRCWGDNDSGQLGDGTTTTRPIPTPVLQASSEPLAGVVGLALGYGYSCALVSGGEARCWGTNGSGQLGNGTTSEQYTPVPVLFAPTGGLAPSSAAPSPTPSAASIAPPSLRLAPLCR